MMELLQTGIAVGIDATGAKAGAGEVNRALDSVKAHARRFTNETRNEFNLLKDNIFDVKNVMATLAAGAAVLGVSALVREFSQFDRGLRDIKSLGVPQTLKEIRTEVMATSKAFGVDAQDSIRSYYDAISSGVDPRNVKQFVETAVMLKDVAQGDLPTALDVLTSAVNAYRKSVDDVDDIADQLAFTVNKGKVTLSQMGHLGQVIPVAAGFGVPLEEILAATATATAGGVGPEQTLTGLRQALVNISNPMMEAQQAARALGIEWNLHALQAQGLNGLLNTVSQAYAAVTPQLETMIAAEEKRQAAVKNVGAEDEKFLKALKEMKAGGEAGAFNALFSSVEALTPVLAIAGQNIDKYNANLRGIADASGTVARVHREVWQDAPAVQIARFNAELADLRATMGELLARVALPFLNDFVVPGVKLLRDFAYENEGLTKAITATGAALGAVYAGGALVKSIQILTSFIGLTQLAGSAVKTFLQPSAATVASPLAALSAQGLQSELALLTNSAAITKSEIDQMKAINFTSEALTGKHKAQIAAIAGTQAAITALEAQTAATLTTTTATKGLWAALAAHPIALTVAGLAALAGGIYLYRKEIQGLLDPQARQADQLRDSIRLLDQEREILSPLQTRLKELADKTDLTNDEQAELRDIAKDLKMLFPDMAQGLDSVSRSASNYADQLKGVNEQLTLQIDKMDEKNRLESQEIAIFDRSQKEKELLDVQEQLRAAEERIANRNNEELNHYAASEAGLYIPVSSPKTDKQRIEELKERKNLREQEESLKAEIRALDRSVELYSIPPESRKRREELQERSRDKGHRDLMDQLQLGTPEWYANEWGALQKKVDPSRFSQGGSKGTGADDPMRSYRDRAASIEREIAAITARNQVYGEGITSNDAFRESLDRVNAIWKATEDVAALEVDSAAIRNQLIQQRTGQYLAQAAAERDLAKAEESRAKTQRDIEAEDLRKQSVAEWAKSLSLERNETVRLFEAQRQGVTAHKDMIDLLDRERLLREKNIQQKDAEYGQALQDLDLIQKTRRATEELTDAQSLARDLGERFDPTVWRSKRLEEINAARKASDVGLDPVVDARAVESIERQYRDMQRQILQDSWDLRDGMELAFWDIRDISDNAAAQVYDAWTGTYRGMSDELTRMLQTGEISIKGFLSVLQGAAAQFASQQIMGSVFNLLGKAFGVAGGLPTPASGPAATLPSFGDYGGLDLNGVDFITRAQGGPIYPGTFTLVGEQGPEILDTRSHGAVYPNGMLSLLEKGLDAGRGGTAVPPSLLSLLEKNLALPRMAPQPVTVAAPAPPPVSNRSVTLHGGIHLSFKLDGNKPISKQAAFETRRAVGAELAALLEEGGRDR